MSFRKYLVETCKDKTNEELKCPKCGSTNIDEKDGMYVCKDCGHTWEMESKIDESKLSKDYINSIVETRKMLLKLSTLPNNGDLYSDFKDIGLKFDDFGLLIKGQSLSKQIGELDKLLQQLEKEARKIK
jgi:ribosomal protein L37AE/L43A